MKLKCKIGDVVHSIDRRNTNLQCDNLLGLSMSKEFRPSTSNIVGTDLSKYKIVSFNEFAVDFMSAIRVHKMPIALNQTGADIIVSPAYGVFAVNNQNVILPEYLMLWFRRPEFDRYADFKSDSAIRGGFDWNELCETEIELPPISEQRKIVHDYQVITDRIELLKKMNENLEEQMKTIYRRYFVDFQPFISETLKNSKLGEIPSSWHTGKLSEVCEMLNGRAYSQDEMLLEGKYKILRVGNFFTNNYWYYSDLELDEDKYCYPGDLLFCWAATLGLYIWNEPKAIYHYHIWKVDFTRSSPMYKEYIYLCLLSEIANMKNAGHGSIMLHLTKENVENMEIVIPPTHVVNDFHNIITPFITQHNMFQKELDILERLKTEGLSRWVRT